MNKFIIVGRVGSDAVLRTTPQGTSVTTISVASTRKWTGNGGRKESTLWMRCNIWGTNAKELAPSLLKGTLVSIMGPLQKQEWVQEGQKRESFECHVNEIQILEDVKKQNPQFNQMGMIDEDENLPF